MSSSRASSPGSVSRLPRTCESLVWRLQADLESLQQQASETAGKLEQESGQAVTLAQENADLLKIVEEMQTAADAGSQEREAALAAAKEQNQQLQQQLEELQSTADAGGQEHDWAMYVTPSDDPRMGQLLAKHVLNAVINPMVHITNGEIASIMAFTRKKNSPLS